MFNKDHIQFDTFLIEKNLVFIRHTTVIENRIIDTRDVIATIFFRVFVIYSRYKNSLPKCFIYKTIRPLNLLLFKSDIKAEIPPTLSKKISDKIFQELIEKSKSLSPHFKRNESCCLNMSIILSPPCYF